MKTYQAEYTPGLYHGDFCSGVCEFIWRRERGLTSEPGAMSGEVR